MDKKERPKLDVLHIIEILNNGFCYPEDLFVFPDSSEEQLKELDQFSCPVCTGIMNDPHIDLCNPPHTYGKQCIFQCLERKKECPLSRVQAHNLDLRKMPLIFSYFFERLRMKCIFSDYGCEWSNEKNKLKQHLAEKCQYKFLIQKHIIITDLGELSKMPKILLEDIHLIQSDVDMIYFPMKSAIEISYFQDFIRLKNLTLEFHYHTFDNYHHEYNLLNSALLSLERLEVLDLTLKNKFVECIDELNFMNWYDIENTEVKIQEIVNWKGLKPESLEIIFNKTFERWKSLSCLRINFSYNGLKPEGISKFMEKINKSRNLREVFLNFENQLEMNVKRGEKIKGGKTLSQSFLRLNLEKSFGFLFLRKNLREVARDEFGGRLKSLIL